MSTPVSPGKQVSLELSVNYPPTTGDLPRDQPGPQAPVDFATYPRFAKPVIVAANVSLSVLDPIAARVGACAVIASDAPVFRFGARDWHVPGGQSDTILLLEPRQALCLGMMRQALAAGIRWVVFPWASDWRREHLAGLVVKQIGEKIAHEIRSRFTGWARRQRQNRRLTGWARLLTTAVERKVRRLLARPTQLDAYPGRVLVVTPSLMAGGAERLAATTYCALRAARVDAHLFSRSLDPRQGHDFYLATVRDQGGEPFSSRAVIGIPPTEADRRLVSQLPAAVREDVLLHLAVFRTLRPQVAHVWQDCGNVAAGLAAALAGVPRIVLHQVSTAPVNFPFYTCFMGPIYRALATHPSVRMVNNSRSGARDYETWLGLPEGGVGVLYSGVADPRPRCAVSEREAFRREWGIAPDAAVIGAVQRMDPVKDPHLWISVATAVARQRPDAVFLLVGDGSALADMTAMAQESGLGGRVIFTGALPQPWAAYRAMDVFLLTSRHEGLPTALVEAQMMGLPVVAADVGGVREAVAVHGCHVVAGRSAAAFAQGVLAILADPNPKEAERRRQWALDTFGLDGMVARTLAAYGMAEP